MGRSCGSIGRSIQAMSRTRTARCRSRWAENTYAVFRASKIAPDHPGLAGRELKPLDPQPEPVTGPEVPPEADE